MNIVKARLYVTTEQVYASGDLFGQWMVLSDYSNVREFRTAFRLLYENELNPDYKLLAWRDIPDCLINNSVISAKIFKLIKMVFTFDKYQKKAFHIWLELNAGKVLKYKSVQLLSQFAASYQGYFKYESDFGKYYSVENLGIYNAEFNYKEFTKQLFEYRFIHINGFVFSRSL